MKAPTARRVIEAFDKAELLELLKPDTVWVCRSSLGYDMALFASHTEKNLLAAMAGHCRKKWVYIQRPHSAEKPPDDDQTLIDLCFKRKPDAFVLEEAVVAGSLQATGVWLACIYNADSKNCTFLAGATSDEAWRVLAGHCRKHWRGTDAPPDRDDDLVAVYPWNPDEKVMLQAVVPLA